MAVLLKCLAAQHCGATTAAALSPRNTTHMLATGIAARGAACAHPAAGVADLLLLETAQSASASAQEIPNQ